MINIQLVATCLVYPTMAFLSQAHHAHGSPLRPTGGKTSLAAAHLLLDAFGVFIEIDGDRAAES